VKSRNGSTPDGMVFAVSDCRREVTPEAIVPTPKYRPPTPPVVSSIGQPRYRRRYSTVRSDVPAVSEELRRSSVYLCQSRAVDVQSTALSEWPKEMAPPGSTIQNKVFYGRSAESQRFDWPHRVEETTSSLKNCYIRLINRSLKG